MNPKFSKAPWLKANALKVIEPKPEFLTLSAMPELESTESATSSDITITDVNGYPIAKVEYAGEHTEANADLLAAAPNLYKQLVWAYTMLLSGAKVNPNDPEMKKTDATLKAALGEVEAPTTEQVKVLQKYIDIIRLQESAQFPVDYDVERVELHEKLIDLYFFGSHLETAAITSNLDKDETPYTLHKKLIALRMSQIKYGCRKNTEYYEECD